MTKEEYKEYTKLFHDNEEDTGFCFTCKKIIDSEDHPVDVSYVIENFYLYFHKKCFISVAGEKYMINEVTT